MNRVKSLGSVLTASALGTFLSLSGSSAISSPGCCQNPTPQCTANDACYDDGWCESGNVCHADGPYNCHWHYGC